MDLEATNAEDVRAGRITRVGMLLCFVVAGGMLIASLATAGGAPKSSTQSITLRSNAL